MQGDQMRKTVILIFISLFLVFLCLCGRSSAGECSYGSVRAYFRFDEQAWQNATVRPILSRGQRFEIQVVVTPRAPLSMFFVKLHEFGTPVYDVLDGPSGIEQTLECRERIPPGEDFLFLWRMQVKEDTSWVNGYAPLELYVQFNENDAQTASVNFDVLIAFIVETSMDNKSQDGIQETEVVSRGRQLKTPFGSFAEISSILVLFIVCCRVYHTKIKKKKKSVDDEEKKLRDVIDRRGMGPDPIRFSDTRQ